MANRYFKRPCYSLEQDVVKLYAQCTITTSGAITSGTVKGGGISGITYTATGKYTVTLQDKFHKVLGLNVLFISTDGISANQMGIEIVESTVANFQSNFRTNKYFSFITKTAYGTAGAPANCVMMLEITLRNSNVAPWG